MQVTRGCWCAQGSPSTQTSARETHLHSVVGLGQQGKHAGGPCRGKGSRRGEDGGNCHVVGGDPGGWQVVPWQPLLALPLRFASSHHASVGRAGVAGQGAKCRATLVGVQECAEAASVHSISTPSPCVARGRGGRLTAFRQPLAGEGSGGVVLATSARGHGSCLHASSRYRPTCHFPFLRHHLCCALRTWSSAPLISPHHHANIHHGCL